MNQLSVTQAPKKTLTSAKSSQNTSSNTSGVSSSGIPLLVTQNGVIGQGWSGPWQYATSNGNIPVDTYNNAFGVSGLTLYEVQGVNGPEFALGSGPAGDYVSVTATPGASGTQFSFMLTTGTMPSGSNVLIPSNNVVMFDWSGNNLNGVGYAGASAVGVSVTALPNGPDSWSDAMSGTWSQDLTDDPSGNLFLDQNALGVSGLNLFEYIEPYGPVFVETNSQSGNNSIEITPGANGAYQFSLLPSGTAPDANTLQPNSNYVYYGWSGNNLNTPASNASATTTGASGSSISVTVPPPSGPDSLGGTWSQDLTDDPSGNLYIDQNAFGMTGMVLFENITPSGPQFSLNEPSNENYPSVEITPGSNNTFQMSLLPSGATPDSNTLIPNSTPITYGWSGNNTAVSGNGGVSNGSGTTQTPSTSVSPLIVTSSGITGQGWSGPWQFLTPEGTYLSAETDYNAFGISGLNILERQRASGPEFALQGNVPSGISITLNAAPSGSGEAYSFTLNTGTVPSGQNILTATNNIQYDWSGNIIGGLNYGTLSGIPSITATQNSSSGPGWMTAPGQSNEISYDMPFSSSNGMSDITIDEVNSASGPEFSMLGAPDGVYVSITAGPSGQFSFSLSSGTMPSGANVMTPSSNIVDYDWSGNVTSQPPTMATLDSPFISGASMSLNTALQLLQCGEITWMQESGGSGVGTLAGLNNIVSGAINGNLSVAAGDVSFGPSGFYGPMDLANAAETVLTDEQNKSSSSSGNNTINAFNQYSVSGSGNAWSLDGTNPDDAIQAYFAGIPPISFKGDNPTLPSGSTSLPSGVVILSHISGMPSTLASDLETLLGPGFEGVGGQDNDGLSGPPDTKTITTNDLENYIQKNSGAPLLQAATSLEWLMSNWNGPSGAVSELSQQDILNVLGGSSISGSENFHESSYAGDCQALSTLNALSLTPEGAAAEAQAITQNPDGSYNVNFAGLPYENFNVTQADILNNTNATSYLETGNKNMAILTAGIAQFTSGILDGGLSTMPTQERDNWLQWFQSNDQANGGPDNLSSDLISSLITGNQGAYYDGGFSGSLATPESASGIVQLLTAAAPDIGHGTAITLGGCVDTDVGTPGFGTVSFGGSNLSGDNGSGVADHCVTVTNINLNGPSGGTVTYENPWFNNVQFTVSVDSLASAIANNPNDQSDIWIASGLG